MLSTVRNGVSPLLKNFTPSFSIFLIVLTSLTTLKQNALREGYCFETCSHRYALVP